MRLREELLARRPRELMANEPISAEDILSAVRAFVGGELANLLNIDVFGFFRTLISSTIGAIVIDSPRLMSPTSRAMRRMPMPWDRSASACFTAPIKCGSFRSF